LYRPAQDSSRSYGGQVVINRVTRLTPTEFEEEPAAVVAPFADTPYPNGVHTLSSMGDVTIVDAKRLVFDHRALLAAMARGVGGRSATAGGTVSRPVAVSRPTVH
jgi:hypothetical protein